MGPQPKPKESFSNVRPRIGTYSMYAGSVPAGEMRGCQSLVALKGTWNLLQTPFEPANLNQTQK